MNTRNHAVNSRQTDKAQVLAHLDQISVHTRQTIEAVKQALLLADGMAIFGSGLANRMNAGTAESWDRKAPRLDKGPEWIEAARGSLAALQTEMSRLNACINDSEEEEADDSH